MHSPELIELCDICGQPMLWRRGWWCRACDEHE